MTGKNHRADASHSPGPSPVLPCTDSSTSSTSRAVALPLAQPQPTSPVLGGQEKEAKGEFMLSWGQGCASEWLRVRIFSDLGRGKQPLRACRVP